jgi:hypothetical protein
VSAAAPLGRGMGAAALTQRIAGEALARLKP